MRLFVAIELNDAVKKSLMDAQKALVGFNRMVRWVGKEQMHLTLKFLGEVKSGKLPEIKRAVEAAATDSIPFDLDAVGTGCFPPKGKVRVVWTGIEKSGDELANCQAKVESELEKVGFPKEERPFSPHLTLGRVKEDLSGGELRDEIARVDAKRVSQRVEKIVLMSSELTRAGARYTKVGTWKLGE